MSTTDNAVTCELCSEAPAEVVDVEHGPICAACHESLSREGITFPIETKPTCNHE